MLIFSYKLTSKGISKVYINLNSFLCSRWFFYKKLMKIVTLHIHFYEITNIKTQPHLLIKGNTFIFLIFFSIYWVPFMKVIFVPLWLISIYKDFTCILSCRFDVECIVCKYKVRRRYIWRTKSSNLINNELVWPLKFSI